MVQRIIHTKVSAIADDPAAVLRGEVVPSDWNDDHQIEGAVEWGEIGGTLASQADLQDALDAKATPGDIDTAIAALVDSSPAALDTLNELAAALGDDPNFATTVLNSLSLKANIAGQIFTGEISATNLAITTGKVLTVTNSLTLAGTDGSTLNIGTGGTLGTAAYRNTSTSGANVPLLNGNNTHSGTFTLSSATGNFGSSTAAATYQFGYGATLSATTKTLNIGTGGVSGSITNINIGSAVSGATGTTTINSPTVNFSSLNTAINVSYLTASRAVFTDGSKNLVSVANTGTGDNVLATNAVLVTPNLGTPSTLVGTNITGTAAGLTAGIASTVSVAAETLDSQCFAAFFTTTSGDLQPKTINAIRADATTGDFYTQGSSAARTARLGGDGYGYFRWDDNGTRSPLKIENRHIGLGANGGAGIEWYLADDTTTTAILAGRQGVFKEQIWTTTTTTQDGYFIWALANNGTLTNFMRLYASTAALTPNANDGLSLGTTSLNWSDLYMATGATINVNNGNWVATHSSGVLNVTTGDLQVTTAGTNAASVVTNNGTQTLNNKRINPRIVSTASSATPTPDIATTDQYNLTALAANATFGAPTGTPLDGQLLTIRIKDNGTIRTLAYNAIYRAVGVTLPAATVSSKTFVLRMIYNSADTKWDVIQVNQEA